MVYLQSQIASDNYRTKMISSNKFNKLVLYEPLVFITVSLYYTLHLRTCRLSTMFYILPLSVLSVHFTAAGTYRRV